MTCSSPVARPGRWAPRFTRRARSAAAASTPIPAHVTRPSPARPAGTADGGSGSAGGSSPLTGTRGAALVTAGSRLLPSPRQVTGGHRGATAITKKRSREDERDDPGSGDEQAGEQLDAHAPADGGQRAARRGAGGRPGAKPLGEV